MTARILLTCSVEGCASPKLARGLCNKHYLRLKTYGDPLYVTPTAAAKERAQAFWVEATSVKALADGPCIEWTGRCNASGYGTTHRNGENVLHRAVWVEMYGQIPDGLLVCHHCDNPPCCRPAHLFLGTVQDNNADRERKGRGVYPGGERHPRAKLTDEQVRQVQRIRRDTGLTYKQIAAQFDVYWGTVYKICHGESRANVAQAAEDAGIPVVRYVQDGAA